mgnify:FL=1|jgi:hypothetical protein
MITLALLFVLPTKEAKSVLIVPFDVRTKPADTGSDDALLLNHVLSH